MKIKTATNKELSYEAIIKRQQNYARRKKAQIRREALLWEVEAENNIISKDNYEIVEYTEQQKIAKEYLRDELSKARTVEEMDMAVKLAAIRYDRNSSSIHEGEFMEASERVAAKSIYKKEETKRINNWINNKNLNVQKYTAFYLIISIPELDIHYDSRKSIWIYDTKTKKNVKKKEKAVWINAYNTYKYALAKILMKLNYEHIIEDEKLAEKDRKSAIKDWLKKEEISLDENWCLVDCIHKEQKEFPAYIISTCPSQNKLTKYSWDPEKQIHERIDENLVEIIENDLDVRNNRPLTFYELEDLIIKGYSDELDLISKDTTEKAFNSKRATASRPVELIDMHPGIDSYYSLTLSKGREDLASLASSYEEPECPMDVDVAHWIWNGEMSPIDAGLLWGNIYVDNTGKRKRAFWLRQAMDILIDAKTWNFNHSDWSKVEEKFQLQVAKLTLKWGWQMTHIE